MPHLGLGLEITSDNRSLATKLANNSTMLIDSNGRHRVGKNKFGLNRWLNIGDNSTFYEIIGDTLKRLGNNDFRPVSGIPLYKLAPNTQYTFKLNFNGSYRFQATTDNLTWFYDSTNTTHSVTFTTDSTGGFGFKFDGGDATGRAIAFNLQIELGSTATAYEPYIANPIGNSPFTNPLVDQSYNGTDLTLVNFAETTLDGYEVITAPNGRQVTALKCDGVDSYGILPNVAGLDPTGLDDFGMAFVIKTGVLNAFTTLYSHTLDTNPTIPHLGFQYNKSGGQFNLRVGGVFIGVVGTMSDNSFYKIFMFRKNNTLYFKLNELTLYNQANSNLLSTTELKRMFARATSADGLTHADFFNGHFLAGDFTLNPSDRWEQDFNNYSLTEYGI